MSSPLSPADLKTLLARVREGDEQALEEVLRHYEPRLQIAARVLLGPMLRSQMDTVDLVQSVHRELFPMLRAGKYDLDDEEHLVALALTIVRRKVAHNWRRLQRQLAIIERERQEGAGAAPGMANRPPDDDPAMQAELNDGVALLLSSIPEDDRKLIELRLAGLSNVEIAQQLHCDAHALRARLSRLRRRLRDAGCDEWI